MELRASPTLSYARRYTSSYLTLRHSRSTNTLSRQAPLPSMLMAMPWLAKQAGEGRTRELRTLVSVEDFRLAMTSERILQRLDAEGCFHRDRQPPGQNPTCCPI